MRIKNRSRWIALGTATAVIVLGTALVRLLLPRTQPRVLTEPVRVADIEQTVLATGTVEPLKLVSVGAQASGRIVALHVTVGDQVKQGQAIAEIDPSTEKNALKIAEATLDQDEAQRDSREAALRQAELAFNRAKETYAAHASSQADYELARATFEGTKADVAALKAAIKQAVLQVDTARVTLGYTKVSAPINGTVVAIVAPEGQTVNAVQAAPTIVKLANLDVMTVKVQISEADVTQVHPGQQVYFTTLGAPDNRYEATLRALEPAPESIASELPAGAASSSSTITTSAIYYNGLFDVPNPDHALRISMTAQVHIVLGKSKGAITIPATALGERNIDGSYTVMTVDAHGKQLPRKISVGLNNHDIVEVLSGLRAGEEVVVGQSGPAGSERPGES